MDKIVLPKITMALLHICLGLAIAFIFIAHRIVPVMLLIPRANRHGLKFIIEMGCWYLQGLGGIYILLTLIKMMKTLKSNPFLNSNVARFNSMGIAALCLSLIAVVAGLLYLTRYALYAIAIIELVCALLSLVLGQVFKKAVEYREENDLVI